MKKTDLLKNQFLQFISMVTESASHRHNKEKYKSIQIDYLVILILETVFKNDAKDIYIFFVGLNFIQKKREVSVR